MFTLRPCTVGSFTALAFLSLLSVSVAASTASTREASTLEENFERIKYALPGLSFEEAQQVGTTLTHYTTPTVYPHSRPRM